MNTDFASRFPQLHQKPIPTPLAWNLAEAVIEDYRSMVEYHKNNKDKEVNLVCSAGGREFDVHHIKKFHDGFLAILGKEEDGTEFQVYATVELVSFIIILSKKTDQKPPREIGFKAEMGEIAKQIS